MFIFLILGLLLGAAVIIFALQNVTPITVVFLGWQFHGSLALILVLAVASGILIYALFSLPEVIRKRFVISKLNNDKEKLKDELVDKKIEVEVEKAKVDANNGYLDSLEKSPRIEREEEIRTQL